MRALVVPGSTLVKQQAEAEGLAAVFTAAGFEWREPGCSMCLGMNPDQVTLRRDPTVRRSAGGTPPRVHSSAGRCSDASTVEIANASSYLEYALKNALQYTANYLHRQTLLNT